MSGGEVKHLAARLKRAIIEHALNAEMSLHLGYAPGSYRACAISRRSSGSPWWMVGRQIRLRVTHRRTFLPPACVGCNAGCC
jgi:transposase-like protein